MSFWGRLSVRERLSYWGRLGRQFAALARRQDTGINATAVILIAALAIVAAMSSDSATAGRNAAGGMTQAKTDAQRQQAAKKSPPPPAKPLNLVSVTPGDGAKQVNGTGSVKVTFSSDLSPSTALPSISPDIAGSWRVSGNTATFTPKVGFAPETTVSVTIPAGMKGVPASNGASAPVLKKTSRARFSTGSYSTTRLQQLLAQLGYLPLTFHSWSPDGDIAAGDAKGQLSAAYRAPAGWFSWNGSWPSQLTSQWKTGRNNTLDDGAVRAFESVQGLTMDGQAGPTVWSHLLAAVAKGQKNPHGYVYALATQGGSENLQVWRNGKRILYTAANTGIAGAPTADGTFPVFDRLSFQIMQGTNPDGSKYADPVHWIAYFDGGDAIHGFERASYGWYQSVGCVEIPVSTAKWLWPYLTYGTLVTVQGPEA